MDLREYRLQIVEEEIYPNPDLLPIPMDGQVGFYGAVLEGLCDAAAASTIEEKGIHGLVSIRMNSD